MEKIKGKNPVTPLDRVDKMILQHLQKNAKFDMQILSSALNMTKTPIYKRIVSLEEAGYITGYVALVDRKLVGLPLMVFCAVSLNIQNAEFIEQFNQKVKAIDEIVECYLTGGVFDFILKVIVHDLEEYNNFASNKLATIPNVGKIQSSFVLNEIKYTTILPITVSK
jgi:DNA-binding Lrp family transcriptional regulator